jgi:hypothetical protein
MAEETHCIDGANQAQGIRLAGERRWGSTLSMNWTKLKLLTHSMCRWGISKRVAKVRAVAAVRTSRSSPAKRTTALRSTKKRDTSRLWRCYAVAGKGTSKERNVREWVGSVGSEGQRRPRQRYLSASMAMMVVVGIRRVVEQCGLRGDKERAARRPPALWIPDRNLASAVSG